MACYVHVCILQYRLKRAPEVVSLQNNVHVGTPIGSGAPLTNVSKPGHGATRQHIVRTLQLAEEWVRSLGEVLRQPLQRAFSKAVGTYEHTKVGAFQCTYAHHLDGE